MRNLCIGKSTAFTSQIIPFRQKYPILVESGELIVESRKWGVLLPKRIRIALATGACPLFYHTIFLRYDPDEQYKINERATINSILVALATT
jgi:hypothetical protein